MLLEKLLNGLDVRIKNFALCKLSPGWRLSLPGPEDGALVHFVLEGDGQMVTLGESTVESFVRRTMVVVPTGVSHALQADNAPNQELRIGAGATTSEVVSLVAGDEKDTVVVVACGQMLAGYGDSLDLFRGLRTPLMVDLSDSAQAATIFEEILRQQADRGPGHHALVDALMFQGLVLFFRRLCEGEECPFPWLAALEDTRLARVLDHILDDPGRPHTVESLAEVAAMSRSAFAKAFVESFGESPKRFVNSVRMHQAQRILQHGDLGVQQLATRLGFSSRSHFSKAFSARYGASPSDYRQTVENGN